MKIFLSLIWLVAAALLAGCASGPAVQREDTYRDHRRIHFEVDGRPCWLILPEKAAPGRPWILRPQFPETAPDADAKLVGLGYHVAYMNIDEMYGSPQAMKHWDTFYATMVRTHRLSPERKVNLYYRPGIPGG